MPSTILATGDAAKSLLFLLTFWGKENGVKIGDNIHVHTYEIYQVVVDTVKENGAGKCDEVTFQ